MSGVLRSELLGTVGLGLLALIALGFTVARAGPVPGEEDRRRLARLVLVALAVQSTHFVEELVAGFHERFPEALGLREWPLAFFVSLNLFWIALWVLSAIGVRRGLRAALFPAWFLGLGCAANAVAHPLLALAAGSYFPGP